MARAYQGARIRIACQTKRVQNGLPPPHWRYEVEEDPDGPRALMHWSLVGTAAAGNNGQGTNPNGDGTKPRAWLEYYGDMVVDDAGNATITLLPLPTGNTPA